MVKGVISKLCKYGEVLPKSRKKFSYFLCLQFSDTFCKVTAEHFKERAKYLKKTAKKPKS